MPGPAPMTPSANGAARSRVDETERALREWLSPGQHRAGDRLPPENDLRELLGVSRGTLRAALERLERSGLVVRRRGSGTFVGELPLPGGFDAGLELLEPYSELARRQGMAIGASDVRIRFEPLTDAALAAALNLEPGAYVRVVERTMTSDGRPAAWMRDVLPPLDGLPDDQGLLTRLLDGAMVLDTLVEAGVPVAYCRTEVEARTHDELPAGAAAVIGADGAGGAALILTETNFLSDGTPVQHSYNAFGPGLLRLHVMRARPHVAPAR